MKGHAGEEGNEGADYLANVGATMGEVPERDWDTLIDTLGDGSKGVRAAILVQVSQINVKCIFFRLVALQELAGTCSRVAYTGELRSVRRQRLHVDQFSGFCEGTSRR